MLAFFYAGSAPYCFAGLFFLVLTQQAYGQAQLFDFDIPAQQLSAALKQYSSLSQQPILIRSQLSEGVQSSAVKGRYTALEALQALLRNTSLHATVIHETSQSIYVIQAQPNQTAPLAPTLQGYPGLIQQQIIQHLCQSSASPPNKYRSLIQISLSPQGRITHVHTLRSNAPPADEQALQQKLLHLQFTASPPPRLPQPITLLLEHPLSLQHPACIASP